MSDYFKMTEALEIMESDEQYLSGIFGTRAEIHRTETGEFEIETELEDGIIRGGQKVTVKLSKYDEIPVMGASNRQGYRCESLVVNGTDLTYVLPKTYFVPRYYKSPGTLSFTAEPSQATDWQLLEIYADSTEEDSIGNNPLLMHRQLQVGTFAQLDEEYRLVLRVFTQADDLFAILHEYGHSLGGDKQLNADRYTLEEAVNKITFENGSVTQDGIEAWKTVVIAETEANQRAIDFVLSQGQNLFPNEGTELWGVRKLIQMQLRNYLAKGDEVFLNKVSKQVVEDITDLQFEAVPTVA